MDYILYKLSLAFVRRLLNCEAPFLNYKTNESIDAQQPVP